MVSTILDQLFIVRDQFWAILFVKHFRLETITFCWFFFSFEYDFFLSDKKSVESRRRKIAHFSLFGSRIQCRFCHEKLKGNKQYFQHIRQFHLPSISNKTRQTLDLTIPPVPEIPTTSQLPTPIKKVNINAQSKVVIIFFFMSSLDAQVILKFSCFTCSSVLTVFVTFVYFLMPSDFWLFMK